jgi:hypothetical protein
MMPMTDDAAEFTGLETVDFEAPLALELIQATGRNGVDVETTASSNQKLTKGGSHQMKKNETTETSAGNGTGLNSLRIQDQEDCYPFDETRDDSMASNKAHFGSLSILESQSLLDITSKVMTESIKAINTCGATPDYNPSSGSCDRDTSSTSAATLPQQDHEDLSETKFDKIWGWAPTTGNDFVAEVGAVAQQLAATFMAELLGEEKVCLHCKRIVYSKDAWVRRVYAYTDANLQMDFLHPSCQRERAKIERCKIAMLKDVKFLRSPIKEAARVSALSS